MRPLTVYITLLALGSFLILAANAFKAWADKRSTDQKRMEESTARTLAETRHQEMLAVVAAAQEQREVYVRAYEDLKAGTSPDAGPVPSVEDDPTVDLKGVDARLDRTLREIAPAMVERLQHERKEKQAAFATDALASNWDGKLRPKFRAMVPVIQAAVMRAKASGLFPTLSLTLENAVPERLIERTYPGEPYEKLMTVRFRSDGSLTWDVLLHRGYALVQGEAAPQQVQMPQLIVYVIDGEEKELGASLNVNPSTLKISGDWVPQTARARRAVRTSAESLKQLDGNELIVAWVGELLGATRLIDIAAK